MNRRRHLRSDIPSACQRSAAPLVLGIIIIVLGSLSFIGSVFDLVMVPVMSVQAEMMQDMQSQMRGINEQAAFEHMEQMMALPDWYMSFMMTVTVISLVILLGYIVAGVLLVIRHVYSVHYYLAFAALLIVVHLLKIGAAVYGQSHIMLMQSFTGILGIVMEIVLILLVIFLVKRNDLSPSSRRQGQHQPAVDLGDD